MMTPKVEFSIQY